jgi:hypothetical protein
VTWGALWMLSGLDAPWLTDTQRSRTTTRLRVLTANGLVDAVYSRAVLVRYRGDIIAVDQVRDSLVLSGTSAQSASSAGLTAPKSADGYCLAATERKLASEYGLAIDRLGQIIIRIPSLAHVVADRHEMPRAVVAVDLASSYESREREAGLAMLSDLLGAVR